MKRALKSLVFSAIAVLMVIGSVSISNTTQAARAAMGIMGAEQSQSRSPDAVRVPVKSDVSPALRTIRPIVPAMGQISSFPEHRVNKGPQYVDIVDPVVDRLLSPLAMPTPTQNFDGMFNYWGGYPPDTSGDVGPNHYVQIVNVGFQIFSKTGASLYGPANNNTLFTGFGGMCEATNRGDPVVLYDPLADRWVMTWFAFTSQSGPTYQCFAVSTSPDATGSYYRYQFLTGQTTFVDYPHLGVWPDAYYMSANLFGAPGGGGNYAFERERMLQGDPNARMVFFNSAASGILPSDLDGPPPPAGSPNYFLEWATSSTLNEYKFHVDWTTPANSTFTGPFSIPVASFDSGIGNVPQPGTSATLDTLSDRLMFRVAYRNLGTHESLLANHTVDSGGDIAGVRWYEIRDPNGTRNVFQQGTYAPGDGTDRWMGSIGMDHQGNIAVGFSASSTTVFPSIRYAGRLVTDPLGQLAQGEETLIAGTGSQTGSVGRWGDYAQIGIDPTDDCTFWFTTEYIQVTGERTWRTRIGSFKFPQCTDAPPTPAPTSTGAPPTVTPTGTAAPAACLTYVGSITGTDAVQTSRLVSVGLPPSTCNVPRSCPGAETGDTTNHNYDSYTYQNTSGSPQCITVNIVPGCSNNSLISIAYLGSYDPANKCANYLADGARGGPNNTYSFTLPAGQTAVVIIYEQSGGVGCENYTLNISSSQCGVGPTFTPGTPTVAATSTSTSTSVPPTFTVPPTVTSTVPPTFTSTAISTTTVTPTGTATVCPIQFSDVPSTDTFYASIRCLACRGIVSGYSDGTFRPNNQVTRGQLAKMVSNSAGFSESISGQTFTDVPPSNTFYVWIERLTRRGHMTGYVCGGPGEPCVNNMPYFRPFANATRGQTSKIVSNAAGFTETPSGQTFEDVPPTSTFYEYIQRLASRNVMQGYACGRPDEPCVPPDNRPYFRPNNDVTRGQSAKIVANTFFPECQTP